MAGEDSPAVQVEDELDGTQDEALELDGTQDEELELYAYGVEVDLDADQVDELDGAQVEVLCAYAVEEDADADQAEVLYALYDEATLDHEEDAEAYHEE